MQDISRRLHQLAYSPWLIVIAFLVAVVIGLGATPLFDVDEGAFSEATREMLVSGNWAATYLNGVPRYDKPILIYWFQALSVSALGQHEWAYRLPSALFCGLWVAVLVSFAREQLGKHRAVIAGLFLVNILWVGMIGRAAIADALLNLILSLTLFDIWRYYQKPKLGTLLRVFAWMGLGFLTKGPVAIVIPAAVSLIFFTSRAQLMVLLRAFFHPLGWCVFLLIILPWLWLVYQDQGIGFFKGFFIDHNLERFSSTKEGHGGNLLYYVLTFPLVVLPFTGLLLRPLRYLKAYWARPFERYCLIWMAVILTIFSVSQTQLPHYVLNAVTPFALLSARYATRFKAPRAYLIPVIGLVVLFLLLPIVTPLFLAQMPAYEQEMLSRIPVAFTTGYYVAAVLVLAALLFLQWRVRAPVWVKLVYAGVLQSIFVFHFVVPAYAELQQAPIKKAALMAKAADADVVAYRMHMPSFSVYRQEITYTVDKPKPGQWVYTRVNNLPRLQETIAPDRYQVLYAEGGVRLVEIKTP
ncbi:Undecaprenyl phosphate-alpha-4-amino-4-deoxy-L-arabinose arabinosyl transferase [BD1-7 clade bacterium]|uniref:Undecaprenyl phosphate-alpha-4-amino-4-deoxy-L-arabinose arabinosyl transferase n=1 Tax=BD1-7 clade bacterium TaxID=2029982 RepID=A0A5S9QEY2_9GAMM|nr:Undecaprenyl phosphate-alpha-4-amino-4-deoxy-L-arabinose arabinosyl transferase [BD1-7 clade bacterium]